MHVVSADIVEVAPAYDTNAELTTMAAADVSIPCQTRDVASCMFMIPLQVLYEVLSVMAKTPLGKVSV